MFYDISCQWIKGPLTDTGVALLLFYASGAQFSPTAATFQFRQPHAAGYQCSTRSGAGLQSPVQSCSPRRSRAWTAGLCSKRSEAGQTAGWRDEWVVPPAALNPLTDSSPARLSVVCHRAANLHPPRRTPREHKLAPVSCVARRPGPHPLRGTGKGVFGGSGQGSVTQHPLTRTAPAAEHTCAFTDRHTGAQ
jgi:hypothetical protein